MARKSNLDKIFYLLSSVVFLAGVIRLYGLTKAPSSPYWEEVALGYDAYSILKTGKDYHNNPFPVVAFPSFGDYKPSLYFYTLVPSLYLFGINDFAIRFPSAVMGTLAVLLVYFISIQLKFSKKIGLLASFILAIMPWHIQFSRAAFEVNLGTTLFLLGILFILKAKNNYKHIFISVIFFVLSMYAYHGFRILSPLTALAIYIWFWKSYNLKSIIISAILSIVLISPILLNLNSSTVSQRFKETSFFPESQAVNITNELREKSGNTVISRIIFHRYWWWAQELTENYLKNFSPSFLFLTGDDNQRHGVGEFGPMYHWQVLALGYALYMLANNKNRDHRLLILLLLLVPIPTMLTKTNPHTLRMLPAAPIFAILSAFGLIKFFQSVKHSKVIILVSSIIIILEGVVFSHYYFFHYPSLSAANWQYGYKETIDYVESIKDKYNTIYFTNDYGRPSIYAMFYGQYDPKYIQSIEGGVKKDQLELKEFGSYKFIDVNNPNIGSLIVTTPKHIDLSTITPLKIINFPDGQPAFIVYEKI